MYEFRNRQIKDQMKARVLWKSFKQKFIIFFENFVFVSLFALKVKHFKCVKKKHVKSEILSKKNYDKPPAALDYNWIIVEPAFEAENVLKLVEGLNKAT